jgi:chromosome segregation ATPase
MLLVENRLLNELGLDRSEATDEPWLDGAVKSEFLKDLCDDVGLRLTDMLSVSSAELGNVLRKLRFSYDQSFLQLQRSWKEVRNKYTNVDKELISTQTQIRELSAKIQASDLDVKTTIDTEVASMKEVFEKERLADKEQIRLHEQQMDQMNSTLKNLNAIFKTMQSDVDAARSADTFARCTRLEKEVAELEAQVRTWHAVCSAFGW